MRFVKTRSYYLIQHPDNRLELVDAGSVVAIPDDDVARQYVEVYGLGEYHPGPASHAPAGGVERPGLDSRQARAERAVAAPQRA